MPFNAAFNLASDSLNNLTASGVLCLDDGVLCLDDGVPLLEPANESDSKEKGDLGVDAGDGANS